MPASPADGTVSVLVLRALLAGAAIAGVESATLSKESGVDPALLDPASLGDPDARVSARVVLSLWEALPRLTDNPHFGLWLAESVRGAPITVATWLITSSSTVGAGIRHAVRFQRLLHDHAESEVQLVDDRLRYVHRIGDAQFRPPKHAIEFGFAQLVFLLRRATGRELVPLRVELQHAAPDDDTIHRRVFGVK